MNKTQCLASQPKPIGLLQQNLFYIVVSVYYGTKSKTFSTFSGSASCLFLFLSWHSGCLCLFVCLFVTMQAVEFPREILPKCHRRSAWKTEEETRVMTTSAMTTVYAEGSHPTTWGMTEMKIHSPPLWLPCVVDAMHCERLPWAIALRCCCCCCCRRRHHLLHTTLVVIVVVKTNYAWTDGLP